jgi:hypothetical protein
MATREEEIEQIDQQVTPVLAKWFWRFYFGSLMVLVLLCYHHVFSVLPHPVTVDGITTGLHKMYQVQGHNRMGGTYTTEITARGIHYTYQGQSYNIIGGWDEDADGSVHVPVIFDAGHPEKAFEFSLLGLMDFYVIRWGALIWIVLSGLLLAFASSDSSFTALDFNIPTLTIKSFVYLLVIILLIPLYPLTDLLLFGKKADGVRGDTPGYSYGHYTSSILFKAGGAQYVIYSEYAEEYEPGLDRHFPVLYWPDNPNRACLYQLGPLYSNNLYLSALMAFSLILLAAWFSASRVS